MKIKQGFILRKVMDNYVVVAVGEASKSFRGMIKLNETAADVWKMIEKGIDEDGIRAAMLEKYQVSEERLSEDIKSILSQLASQGFLEV